VHEDLPKESNDEHRFAWTYRTDNGVKHDSRFEKRGGCCYMMRRFELELELPNNEPVNRSEGRENATRDHWMASSLTKEMTNGNFGELK
jgi:hypothetical protein